MLIRTIKMTFWVLYDHVGKLLVANMLCAFLVVLPLLCIEYMLATSTTLTLSILAVIPICLMLIILPMFHIGLLWMVKELIEKRDGSLKTIFIGIKCFGLQALILFLIYLFAISCVLSSIWFYGQLAGNYSPLIQYGLGAFSIWIIAFLIATAIFSLPALVNKNNGVIGAIKLAFALVIDNPVFTLGILIHIAVMIAFSFALPFLLCFSFSPIAVLQGSAYEILSRKYRYLSEFKKMPDNKNKAFTIDFGDENDEYLCRGFRDLLFPWKE